MAQLPLMTSAIAYPQRTSQCALARNKVHIFPRRRTAFPVTSEAQKYRYRRPTAVFKRLKNAIDKMTVSESTDLTSTRSKFFSDNAPSWKDLSELMSQKESELNLKFRETAEELLNGPTTPRSLRRTFGSIEEPRVKLYRDHAAWCPYCEKVWFQLEEKRIPYVIEKVNMRCYGDKPMSYLKKTSSGLLPALEIDDKFYTESEFIMFKIEETFQNQNPLLPAIGSEERNRAESLLRLERALFGRWLGWLCQDWGNDRNMAGFIEVMDAVDGAIQQSGGPYFLGKTFSLVDIVFAPFLERIAASIVYYKGFVVRGSGKWKSIEKWFEEMEKRPTFSNIKSDYYTHCHDLPPQLGGCVSIPGSEATAANIDGKDGSWKLPLDEYSTGPAMEPLDAETGFEKSSKDRLEAATRLIENHEAVVKFALRGPGRPGPRPVSAPFSDPTAVPALEWQSEVDCALRHVAHALICGVDSKQSSANPLAVEDCTEQSEGLLDGQPLSTSLGYLRDRVGVPRDMRFPAARQFRAHLNWAIDVVTA